MNASFQFLRIVAVIALVCIAAALATPKGRLPLALRGLARLLRQDAASAAPAAAPAPQGAGQPVPPVKRLLAFSLVLLAILLAIA